jgi:hypothetical protein
MLLKINKLLENILDSYTNEEIATNSKINSIYLGLLDIRDHILLNHLKEEEDV